jgi:hypothetical protein
MADPLDVECPKCRAAAGYKCRNYKGKNKQTCPARLEKRSAAAIIEISADRQFVECLRDGKVSFRFAVSGFLHDVVDRARNSFRKWTRPVEPEIGEKLQQMLHASDSLVTKMAFGEEYK